MKAERRMMPHSLEGEQSVLGCVLIDNQAPMDIFAELKSEDFYLDAHKTIFSSMSAIYNSNKPVDFVTLVDKLEKDDTLESVGGIEYITTLTNIVPSASNYRHYMDIVKRDSVLRQLIAVSNEIQEKAYSGVEKDEAIGFAEKNIYDIGQNEERSNLTALQPAFSQVLEKFEIIQKDKDSLRGIPTGLYGLDKVLNGLQRSDLILVAARPGCGKTSLAMNMVNNAAVFNGKKVAVFSLEMPKVQLAQRSLCSIAHVDMGKALSGKLEANEWKALWGANEKFSNASIFVDDSSLNTPIDILNKCRRLKREQGGLDIIMIDYLQLMSSGLRVESRQQEVSDITRRLKIIAKELDVPVIVLSQLSRNVESRPNHRPLLSDLRESGAIEQDADIVLFIYRPDMYSDTPETERGNNIAEIIVAKHRNGSVTGEGGGIKVKWIPEFTTFANIERDSNAESLERSIPKEQKTNKTEQTEDLPEIVPLDESDITDIF